MECRTCPRKFYSRSLDVLVASRCSLRRLLKVRFSCGRSATTRAVEARFRDQQDILLRILLQRVPSQTRQWNEGVLVDCFALQVLSSFAFKPRDCHLVSHFEQLAGDSLWERIAQMETTIPDHLSMFIYILFHTSKSASPCLLYLVLFSSWRPGLHLPILLSFSAQEVQFPFPRCAKTPYGQRGVACRLKAVSLFCPLLCPLISTPSRLYEGSSIDVLESYQCQARTPRGSRKPTATAFKLYRSEQPASDAGNQTRDPRLRSFCATFYVNRERVGSKEWREKSKTF